MDNKVMKMNNYRELIRAKRKKLGISQTKLAERVHITQPYLYEIESGRKTPSVDLLIALCEALDIKLFPDE